uniref:Transcriptional regulator NikR, CopG family n=1 Tax=uncultured organism TaxID=155900 RepID=M1Q1F0_9ZZZZ|nr:transcriptional regulator NikR, CopG family [uncultured organism]
MDNTKRFGVSVPPDLLEKFDEKIDEKMYTNRSEAIRDLIREFLVEEKWEESDEEVYGSLTLIFDHEQKGISDKLTELQHQDHTHIVSTMHIHLDEHNCMETMAIKGKPQDIKQIADKLISTKGVKHGKLMMTSV